jgi:hypothetical protein
LSLADNFAKLLYRNGLFEDANRLAAANGAAIALDATSATSSAKKGLLCHPFGADQEANKQLLQPEWTGIVATDVGCAGSCPILTLVRVVPTAVER